MESVVMGYSTSESSDSNSSDDDDVPLSSSVKNTLKPVLQEAASPSATKIVESKPAVVSMALTKSDKIQPKPSKPIYAQSPQSIQTATVTSATSKPFTPTTSGSVQSETKTGNTAASTTKLGVVAVTKTITVVSPSPNGQTMRAFVPKFAPTVSTSPTAQLPRGPRMLVAVKNKTTSDPQRVYGTLVSSTTPTPVRTQQTAGIRPTITLLPQGAILAKSGVLAPNVQMRQANVVRSRDGKLQISNGTVIRQISMINPDLQKRLVGTGSFPQYRLLRASGPASTAGQPIKQLASVLTSCGEKKFVINANVRGQVNIAPQPDPSKIHSDSQVTQGKFANYGSTPIAVNTQIDCKSIENGASNEKVLKIPFAFQPTKETGPASCSETKQAEESAKKLETKLTAPAEQTILVPSVETMTDCSIENQVSKQTQPGFAAKTISDGVKPSAQSERQSTNPSDTPDAVKSSPQLENVSTGPPLKEIESPALHKETSILDSLQEKSADTVAAEEPVEKISALRKTNILSFKPKNRILAGPVLDKESKNTEEPPPFIPLLEHRVSGSAERRKRKDDHRPKPLPAIERNVNSLRPGPLKALDCLKGLPGIEGRNALRTVKWDGNGTGVLPGSSLTFKSTEHGTILLSESSLANKITYFVDPADGRKKIQKRDSSEIYCCVVCECYGLLSEYVSDNFCSTACYESIVKLQDSIVKEMEAEMLLDDTPPFEVDVKKRKRLPTFQLENVTSDDKKKTPSIEVVKKRKISVEDVENKRPEAEMSKAEISPVPSDKETSDKPLAKIKIKSLDMLTQVSPTPKLNKPDNSCSLLPSGMPAFINSLDLDSGHLLVDEEISVDDIPFEWTSYLKATQSRPANAKLFSQPLFTAGPNPFQIGYKLEAVDPERQSKICVATIADVSGHRLKIHFDGYSNKYDFWTYTHSPNIFPCGFCQENGYPLEPPVGFAAKNFKWEAYHKSRKSRPAPNDWFASNRLGSTSTNMFKVNMKLEAVDKKNTHLTCVATVRNVLLNQILVHFDSWSDIYDYWVDVTSPYIHPVGWCQQQNRSLTPPEGYDSEKFTWPAYLKLTGSEQAPKAAFVTRPPIEFVKGTKLEVVDKRATNNLRVATISEVLPYQIKIAFDGYPDHFGYWCDDDSPDLHPVGYGQKTGHPVLGPPTVHELLRSKCPTPGCIGEGNVNAIASGYHQTVEECPYSNKHLKETPLLVDRLKSKAQLLRKKLPEPEAASDEEYNPEKLWKFIDEAAKNTVAKMRLLHDDLVTNEQPPQQYPSLYLPQIHQQFVPSRPPSKASSASSSTTSQKRKRSITPSDSGESRVPSPAGKAIVKTEPVDQCKETAKHQKPAKVSKTVKTENKKNKEPDVADLGDKEVLTWPAQLCLEKIVKFAPSIREKWSDLDMNGSRLLMMDSSNFESMPVNSPDELSKFLDELRKKAVVGLSTWKLIE